MNALTAAIAEQTADPAQVGEITSVWKLTANALMLIGWQHDRLAASGTVSQQRRGEKAQEGQFSAVSWPASTGGSYFFLAAVRLPAGAAVRAGETFLLSRRDDRAGVLAHLPSRFLDDGEFGAELARITGRHAASVARFLNQTFSAAATRSNAAIRAMMAMYLTQAAEADGCVEILGGIEGHCAVLQGWGAAPGGDCELLLVGSAIERHMARVALFERPDIKRPASGQLIVLPTATALDMRGTTAIVLIGRDTLHWRPVMSERRLLSELETAGELRDRVPSLRCDAPTREILRVALRPRFDGRFTLHDGGRPVRLALDVVAAAPAAGIYLTGWLYDPASIVTEVWLRATSGQSFRLDTVWTRIPREDVTAALCNDPALPKPGAGARHGFAVHAASLREPGEEEALYLEVLFREESCGFVPLAPGSALDEATRSRLLEGVDLHKPSAMQVIEGHVAPFFSRLPTEIVGRRASVLAALKEAWSTVIVVPLAENKPPRALLAQFLRDPLDPEDGIAFVCGENWTDADLGALRSLASLYGQSPALLRVAGPVAPKAALAEVASISRAKRLLLMSAGTIGCSRLWRRALHDALDAEHGLACASPTVAYEDDSIRFAGISELETIEAAPYVRIARRLAGMPASLVEAQAAAPSLAGSLACCLVPREAASQLVASPIAPLTPAVQEIGLFLELRQIGVTPLWVSAAQVYATESREPSLADNVSRVASFVDHWCLRARLLVKE